MTADDWRQFDAKTDDEIAADAAYDPDCPSPKLKSGPSRAKRLALAKRVRQKLRLTHEAFSAAYGIPLATLIAWERHELRPTPSEEVYLRLIAREPDRAKLIDL